jgi:hypothetical protein
VVASGLDGLMFSQVEQYRRWAIAARQRAADATNPDIRQGFDEIANHWSGLAEQTEWLGRQFASMQAPQPAEPNGRTVPQQQQQMQPGKQNEGEKS